MNTCKIAFQVIVFLFLSLVLVFCLITKVFVNREQHFGQDSSLFDIFVDFSYLGFLFILYKLGTAKVTETKRSEASTRASTRFTVNEELERDDSCLMMFLESEYEMP